MKKYRVSCNNTLYYIVNIVNKQKYNLNSPWFTRINLQTRAHLKNNNMVSRIFTMRPWV